MYNVYTEVANAIKELENFVRNNPSEDTYREIQEQVETRLDEIGRTARNGGVPLVVTAEQIMDAHFEGESSSYYEPESSSYYQEPDESYEEQDESWC